RSEFVVEKINPWEKLDVFHFPVTDNSIIKYDYSVLIGGVQFGGVLITNTTDKTINLEIEQTKDLEIYQAPRISTLTNAYNVDPMVPIVSNTTSIPAGENQILIFKVKGLIAEDTNSFVKINSKSKSVNLDINITSFQPSERDDLDKLNVNTWAYLHYPMLENRKLEAVSDLE